MNSISQIILILLIGISLVGITVYFTTKYIDNKQLTKPNISQAANPSQGMTKSFDAYGYLDCLEGASGPYQTVKSGCQDLFGIPPPQGGAKAHWSDTTTEYKLEGTYGQ